MVRPANAYDDAMADARPPETLNDQQSCPFCRIIRGEDAGAEVLWREPGWIAFFPDTPATLGHTLVVPTEHITDYWEADSAVVSLLAPACLGLGRAIQRALAPSGMNLISSRGEVAEQTVPHLHMHVVPRWESDQIGSIWPPKAKPDSATLARVAVGVRAAMRAS
jgi:histidine triad (HIT) family protein